MILKIEELSHENLKDFHKIDNSFEVSSVLELGMVKGEITYEIRELSEVWEKKYGNSQGFDPARLIDSKNGVIFLAYLENQIAGRIVLKKNWNKYAYIDDIAVDRSLRRRGIGRQLLSAAIRWAREKNFPGLMLETQNINVGGCKLYDSLGFQLGGFDKLLYKAIKPPREEIALYWYLIF
ncbi:MAG: GNAT family N-acetyltransferase [Candidatus Hodarchaeota archaeon]